MPFGSACIHHNCFRFKFGLLFFIIFVFSICELCLFISFIFVSLFCRLITSWYHLSLHSNYNKKMLIRKDHLSLLSSLGVRHVTICP